MCFANEHDQPKSLYHPVLLAWFAPDGQCDDAGLADFLGDFSDLPRNLLVFYLWR